MTKDELRQKCIKAMALAMTRCINEEAMQDATIAFDALHGLVRVVPIEATEEMIKAGGSNTDWEFTAMAAAGDLTRPR